MNRVLAPLRRPAAGLVALALLPLLVYGRFILGDELYNPDVFLAYRPVHAWLADGLRRGTVPLWSAELLGGFPLAFSEYGWFSPLNWLPLALLGGHAGFYLAVAMYVALAGIAMWLLARRWGASPVAAALAGVVYAQSPFVVAGTPLLNQGAAYWTLPAGLYAVDAALRGRPWGAPAVGAVIALALLGSHPQLAIIALVPPALYAAGAGIWRRCWRALLSLGLAGALGAAISAVRFIPTLPLVAASERSGGLALGASAIGSVAPHALLAGLIFPSLQVPRYLSPQWTAYLGLLPLSLALGQLRALRQPRSGWLCALGIAGLVLALGTYTPVFWAVQRTPLLAYFREPSRFLLWTVLAVALLSAFALDAALAPGTPRRRRRIPWGAVFGALTVIGFVAASIALRSIEAWALERLYLNVVSQIRVRDFPQDHYAALARGTWLTLRRSVDPLSPGVLISLASICATAWWWRWGRWGARAAPTALACAALPLLAYGQVRLPAVPRTVVRESVAALAHVPGSGQAEHPSRVLSWLPLNADFEQRVRLEGAGQDADVASYRLLKQLLAPNFGLATGVPQLDGYENLMSREQALLTAALGSERTGVTSPLALGSQMRLPDRRRLMGERWGLAEAAGVGMLLSVERTQPLTWPMSVDYEPHAYQGHSALDSVNTFRAARPAPRAWVARTWRIVPTAEDGVRSLARGELDGAPETVITGGAGVPRPRELRPGDAPTGPAVIRRYSAHVVEVEAEADTDSLLVLLDAAAPGWTATVTGAPVPILTANVAFRAVPIPAGRHMVRFEYTPPGWQPALATTGLATVALALWLGVALGVPRRRGARSTSGPEPSQSPG